MSVIVGLVTQSVGIGLLLVFYLRCCVSTNLDMLWLCGQCGQGLVLGMCLV